MVVILRYCGFADNCSGMAEGGCHYDCFLLSVFIFVNGHYKGKHRLIGILITIKVLVG